MKFHQSPTTFVGEANIKVKNLEHSLEFYKKVVGFKVLEQTGKTAKLTANEKTTLLSLEQIDNPLARNPKTTGLFHFAILLPTRYDLGRFLLHLAQLGIQMGAGDHDVSEAIYFNDPDGNGIEVYRDRPSNKWEWTNGEVKMGTKELDAQAIVQEGKGHEWISLPSDTVMGHIHLQVSDLKSVEEFYRKGLGFDVVCRYGKQALFISKGGYHHHIGLNTWNSLGASAPDKNSVGLKWFSLEYPNEEERAAIITQLKQIGVAIEEVNGHYMVVDPSGNHILLRYT